MFGFGPAHTGFNPFETKIGVSNVSGLQEKWTAQAGEFNPSAVAVANGVAFVGGRGNGTVYAFDAKGVTNCSGSPTTCAPLWSFSAPTISFGAPSVSNGVM